MDLVESTNNAISNAENRFLIALLAWLLCFMAVTGDKTASFYEGSSK